MLFTIHKRLKVGRLIQALTLNDITFWGGFDMLQVVFALFVVQNIEGGSAADIGIALFLYKASATLVSIPLGTLFDSIKSLNDERIGLTLSSLITGTMYILLAFSSFRWQLFLIMTIVGMSRSLNLNSWRKIFNKSLSSKKTGTELGVYDTVFSLGTALMNVLAGFMSELYGIQLVLVVTGIVVYSGIVFPFLVRRDIQKIL